MQNRVTLGYVLGYALVVVGTGEPGAVVIDILNIDNDLGGVGVGRAAKVLGTDDQLVGILEKVKTRLENIRHCEIDLEYLCCGCFIGASSQIKVIRGFIF